MSTPKLSLSQTKTLEDMRSTVAQFGSTSFQTPGDWLTPPHSYTIGLFQSYKHPEILILNPELELAARILQDAAERIRGGEPVDIGKEHIGFISHSNCVYRAVDRKHYSRFLKWATYFYGDTSFPAMQLVWSDSNGLYPWDHASTFKGRLKRYQPLLFSGKG